MKSWKGLLLLLSLALILCLFAGCDLAVLSEEAPFSEEAFLARVEEGVLARSSVVTYTCKPQDGLDELVDAAVEKACDTYIIGVNVASFEWHVQTFVDAEITLTLALEDTFVDGRDQAIPYSVEETLALAEQGLLHEGKADILFVNDGTLTEEIMSATVESCVTQSPSALIQYYVEQANSSCRVYDDYARLIMEFEIRPDTRPFDTIPVPADMQEGVEYLTAQWDEGDSACLYYPQGAEDVNTLCEMYALTAQSNDADDPFVAPQYEWQVYGQQDCILVINKLREVDTSQLSAWRQEMLTQAEELAASLTQEDPKEKVVEIGKILAGRIRYDDELVEELKDATLLEASPESCRDRTAYGALVEGKTVCSGYARAFKLVCDLEGIDCWVVDGTTADAPEEGHEWNMVLIDGTVYYVDITFADTGKMKKYYLFEEKLYQKEGYKVQENYYIPWTE